MLPVEALGKRFKRSAEEADSRESSVESRAKAYAKKLGYLVRKFKAPGKSAVPDDIFVTAHGFVYWVEFKAKGKPATEAQLEEHKLMRKHGLIVYVVDAYEDAKRIIDKHSLD